MFDDVIMISVTRDKAEDISDGAGSKLPRVSDILMEVDQQSN
jgi:hypothetical protein